MIPPFILGDVIFITLAVTEKLTGHPEATIRLYIIFTVAALSIHTELIE